MKKKNLLLGGLLMFTMTFSTVALVACHDDDKKNEEVIDPLETEKEYYIVGTVSDVNGVLTGAKVDAGNSITATTDANGVYMLTVKDTGKYTLKFTAADMQNLESEVSIASDAANRTQATLNVKMAKAISFEIAQEETVNADEETTVEAADNSATGGSGEPAPAVTTTNINVPQGAAEEGTKIAAVTYDEPKIAKAEEAPASTPKEEKTTLSAVAIKVTPADAVAKAPIEIQTASAQETDANNYFDPKGMEALKDAALTRAAIHFGDVTVKDGKYIITIPKGEVIAGKYLTNLVPTKTVGTVQKGKYNLVNNEEGILKIENRDYAAKNVILTVVTTCGWEYMVSPEAALKEVGAPSTMAGIIEKCIRESEGSKNGIYTVSKELKAAISGNNMLLFGSHAKVQDKTYTFAIIVKGQSVKLAVKLRSYVGYTEEYSNKPISQHSGGTTGGQN